MVVRRRHTRATIALRDDGALRVVAVADTHSNPHAGAALWIKARQPDHILHAGDIGELAVLDRLGELAPVLAVRGNIDGQDNGLPDTMTIEIQDRGATLFKILLLHIAVYGPKLRADAAKLAREEAASLVVCGHSHVPFIAKDKGLSVFNPGSIGPRRFTLPIVFGVIEISRQKIGLEHVSCETGERWLPG
jgi:putative phosphoesterase